MKQILLFLLILFSFSVAGCDKEEETNAIDFDVPELTDENSVSFTITTPGRRWLSLNIGGDKVAIDWGDGNDNGYRVPANEECIHQYGNAGTYQVRIWAENLTFLNLTSMMQDLNDLKIGYCPKLTDLVINSFSNIEDFKIENCPQLKSLNIGNWENLASLDISKCTELEDLDCYTHPKLTALNLSGNKKLKELSLSHIMVDELDLSNNTELSSLTIRNGNITKLSVENNKYLTLLYCQETAIEELLVANDNDITEIVCNNATLEELDLTRFPNLRVLVCDYNNLTELDLSACPKIEAVSCTNNKISNLILPDNTILRKVYISSNELDAATLNEIFTDLPEAYVKYPYNSRDMIVPNYSNIQFNYNPGTGEAKKDIIKKKGWRIVEEQKKE